MPTPRHAVPGRSARRLATLALAALGLAGCERPKAGPATESVTVTPPPPSLSPPVAVGSGWDSTRLGPALLVQGDEPSTAIVVAPDSLHDPVLARARAVLLGRDGRAQEATIAARTEAHGEACAGFPIWRLTSDAGIEPWSIGVAGGALRAVSMDSLGALSPNDSSRLTAQVTRLASALPSEDGERFRGLPFAVQSLFRFRLPSGGEALAANLLRQIGQEAQPLEERTLLIAERDSGSTEYRLAYHERSSGNEETVESRDILAAALLGQAREPLLFVGRDFGDRAAYSLIDRQASGQWRLRWTSARVRC